MASYLISGDTSFCCGCRACEQRCPKNCITMEERNGLFYPVIDKDNCINCKLCEKVCQYSEDNQKQLKNNHVLHTFAAWNKDEKEVIQSTSGGMFLTLARKIIDANGVVFGAKYTSDFSVDVAYGQTVDECKAFRKSKYVFSNTKETYKQAEAFLKEGRRVLFSGTPCQISGLYSFLGKQYDNLITVDIVCHGFNAPILLKSFLEMLEKQYGGKTNFLDFRSKVENVSEPYLKVSFNNGSVHTEPYRASAYGVLYGSHAALMPSCTSCQYTNTHRIGDITIGDYWGVEKYYPQAHNIDGTSLIFVNSEKGKQILDEIKEDAVLYETDLESALKQNQPLRYASPANPFAKSVISSLKKKGFKKTYTNYKFIYSKLFLVYRLFRKIKNKLFH